MFKLHLDMALYFVEPMSEHGEGIRVTKCFELPFAPHPEILLNAGSLNEAEDAMGFKLEEVTWDLDREVFFGRTRLILQGDPIAFIPLEIRSWIKRGWRFGSYEDTYAKPDGRSNRSKRKRLKCDWDWSEDDEVVEQWPRMSTRARPASFNTLFKAVIREMVLRGNNTDVAYAMAKTRRHFTEQQLKDNDATAAKKFKTALDDFSSLPYDRAYDWERSVLTRYPRLEQYFC